jgi:superfamily II DNA/RNA helicase
MTAWRDKVMRKVTQFKWVPKEEAPKLVFDALQPAIRFKKSECLDLPPVITETREVPLTPQQKKFYNQLKERMLVSTAGETITAVNAAAGVNKLLQISAGAAYTDDHEVVEFDCSNRLSVLMEVLEETSRKVLVFAPFRHSIDTIATYLEKHKIPTAVIHGDISAGKRTAIFKEFQETDTPRVLVIQPQSASHGVTLTAADTVVFWGPVMSVETYIQCCARSDRKGQDSDKVTVVHLQGSEIEKRMFKQLEDRVEDHGLLIKLYEEEIKSK